MQRHYLFCIKKCGEAECNICAPVRLPVSVFQQIHLFQTLFLILAKNTIFHLQNCMEHKQLNNIVHHYRRSQLVVHMEYPSTPQANMLLIHAKLSDALKCGKQRVIYAARKLKYEEMERLKRVIDGVQYSCGSVLKDIDCSSRDQELTGKVYIRANLTCSDKVEVPFYLCGVHDPICIHCGVEDDLISRKLAKPVYPTCSTCFSSQA